jgi:hypothetical protein
MLDRSAQDHRKQIKISAEMKHWQGCRWQETKINKAELTLTTWLRSRAVTSITRGTFTVAKAGTTWKVEKYDWFRENQFFKV